MIATIRDEHGIPALAREVYPLILKGELRPAPARTVPEKDLLFVEGHPIAVTGPSVRRRGTKGKGGKE